MALDFPYYFSFYTDEGWEHRHGTQGKLGWSEIAPATLADVAVLREPAARHEGAVDGIVCVVRSYNAKM
jgi:hypothetical protein